MATSMVCHNTTCLIECIHIISNIMYSEIPIHREHDKGPDEFCEVLLKLSEAGKEFLVSFLGSHTKDIPGL